MFLLRPLLDDLDLFFGEVALDTLGVGEGVRPREPLLRLRVVTAILWRGALKLYHILDEFDMMGQTTMSYLCI